jgi:hypothetical protein
MIGHDQWGTGPIRVLSYHRDMVTFPDKMKPKTFQDPDDFLNRLIHGQLRHQTDTPASAMNASKMGGPISAASVPNVST